jgi:hypothetical protein
MHRTIGLRGNLNGTRKYGLSLRIGNLYKWKNAALAQLRRAFRFNNATCLA